jgi:hypothetical protein
MKVSTENDNNFGYEKIAIVVDNIPLSGPLEHQRRCHKLKKHYEQKRSNEKKNLLFLVKMSLV